MIRRFLSLLLLAALLAPSSGFAAAVQVEMLLGGIAASGVPLSGGKVYTYAAGDFTPAPTWSNSTKTATNTNPITLDINGRASVYAEGLYKFIIKDADGITVATYDNLTYMSPSNPTSMTIADMAATNGTISNLYSPRSILASSTISASLLSNSRLSGNVLLEAPTAASHPVNLGYLSAEMASETSYFSGITSSTSSTLAAHLASATNPHGSVLTQTQIIANKLSYASSTADGGYISPTTDGLDVFGRSSGNAGVIAFRNPASASKDLYLEWCYSNPRFVSMISSDKNRYIMYNIDTNTVDFCGASLTNFGLSSTTIAYISSVVSAPQSSEIQFLHNEISPAAGLTIGSSSQNILPITIPASFSAGYYDLDLYMNISNWGSGNLVFIAYLPMAPGNDGYRTVNVPNNGDLTHLSCHTLKFFNPSDGFSVQVYTATGTAYVSNCQLTATYRGPSLKAY